MIDVSSLGDAGGAAQLIVEVLSDTKDATKGLADVDKSVVDMGSKLGGLAVAGFAAATGGALAFGIASAGVFADVGGEIIMLKRVTGDTTEEASRLRFAFQQSGIDADTAASRMGFFSKNLVSSTDGMKDFGVATRDAQGNLLPMNDELLLFADKISGMPDGLEKNALVMKAFGKGGADMVPFLNRGREGITAFMAEADKFGVVLGDGQLAAVVKSKEAHRQYTASMEGLQIMIGQYVLPMLTTFVLWFSEFIPKATKTAGDIIAWFTAEILPTLKSVAETTFAVLTTSISWLGDHQEVLIGLAFVVGTLVVTAMIAWAIAAGQAAVAMIAATWPIILVVAVLGALVAAVVYAYTHFEWFRDTVQNAMLGAQMVIEAVVGFIQDIWVRFHDQIMGVVMGAWGIIQAQVQGAMDVIQGIIKVVTSLIKGDWGGAWDGIKQIFEGVWESIKGTVTGGLNIIKNLLSVAWESIKGTLNTAWQGFSNNITQWIDNVLVFVAQMPGRMIGFFLALPGRMNQLGGDIIQGLWNGIKWLWDSGVIGWFAALPGKIIGAIPNAIGWLWDTGKNIVSGLINGLEAALGWARDRILVFAKALIPDVLEGFLGLGSPSRMTYGFGVNIVEGLVNGMVDNSSAVEAASRTLAAAATTQGSFGMDFAATGIGGAGAPPQGQAVAPVIGTLVVNEAQSDPMRMMAEAFWQATAVHPTLAVTR